MLSLNKFKISLFALALSAISSISIAHANTAERDLSKSEYTNALKNVKLKVAVAAFPPFIIVDNKKYSTPNGIEIEILEELQKRLGFSLSDNRYNFSSFSEVMSLGLNKKVDIMAGGISLTEKRKTIYKLSPAYYQSSQALAIRKDLVGQIKDFNDLDGRTLSVEQGVDPRDLVPNINIKLKEYPSSFSSFYAITRGESDGTITDYPAAVYYANKWPKGNLAVVAQTNVDNPEARVGFAYRNDFPYADYFNSALNDMLDDGSVQKILDKYLKK